MTTFLSKKTFLFDEATFQFASLLFYVNIIICLSIFSIIAV